MLIRRACGENPGILAPVQYLRAIAATMVLASHCLLLLIYLRGRFTLDAIRPLAEIGAVGVTAFFVISGFIMYYTTTDTSSPADFIRRRLHRILPLYWLMLIVQLILVALAGHAASGGQVLRWALLLPQEVRLENPESLRLAPLLGVAWTLTFEMMFYAVFAAGLFFRRRKAVVLLLLGGLIVLGMVDIPLRAVSILTSPIVALFGIGVVLGWLRARIPFRLTVTAGTAAIIALAMAIPLLPAFQGEMPSQLEFEPVRWALGIALAAGAIFTFAGERDGPLALSGVRMGDASYFLYLSHPLMLMALGGWAAVSGFGGSVPEWVAGSIFALCLIASPMGHALIERPLARVTRSLFKVRAGNARPAIVSESPVTWE